MPANAITAVGGNTVNGATSYKVVFPAGDPIIRRKTLTYAKRRNAGPQVIGRSWEPLEFKLQISAADAETSYATLKTTIEQWFQPWSDAATAIVAVWHDSTPVSIDAELIELRPTQDAGALRSVQYEAVCIAPYPLWRKTTTSTSTGNPNNAGNTAAAATLELTTATHKQLRECSVAGAGAGGGMMGYPVRLAYTQASLTSDEVFTFVNGANTPTYSDNYSAYVWTIVDTSQDASIETLIDLLTIDGVATSNPVGGRLEQGGLKLGDAVSGTDCSNTSWTWNDFQITQNPIRCGAWRPALIGSVTNMLPWIDAESASGVTFKINDDPIGSGTQANAMAMVIGSQGNSLSGLSRTVTSDTNSRAFVAVRAFGSANWTIVWSIDTSSTTTTSVSLGNAVEVAVGIDALTNAINTGTLALAASGGTFTLSLNATPTVTVGVASNADYYNGTFSNSTTGESIEFKDVVVKDGTLYLDSLERLVYSSVGAMEPIYGDFRFSDDDNWLLLEPGANVISNGVTGSSYSVSWSESFA